MINSRGRGSVLKIYKFALIGALVGLALLLPEVLSRIFFPEWKPPASDKPSLFVHHPQTGWMHPASTTMEHYGGNVTSNAFGLRGEVMGEKNKPRVLFLGDSFTWGWSIGKNENRYTDRLQQHFPDYQFMNAGIIGFNTLQEFLLFRYYFDDIKPDYLVLQVFANDFPENLTAKGIYPRPHFDARDDFSIKNYPAPDASGGWIKKSIIYVGENTYFYRQMIIRAFMFMLDSGMTPEEEEKAPAEADMLKGMENALALIFQFAGEHHLPVMVIFSGLNESRIKVIENSSGEYQISTINLDRAFDSASHEWKDHTEHWNDYGHALVAAYLQPSMIHFINEPHE